MTSLRETISRRRFLVGSTLASIGLISSRLRASMARQPTEYGDCSVLPALEWYRYFISANFVALPSRGLNDHLPQKDWQPAEDPELGVFLVPPGWTTVNVFANEFERDGTPRWQGMVLPHPRWSATMVTAPDEEAFFMTITGGIDNVALDSAEGAALSRELAIGAEMETTSLCLLEDEITEGQLPLHIWLSGDTFGDHLMMTNGQSFSTDFAGFSGAPGSRFTTNILVCPTEESSEYMQDVFLRILWQFVPRAAGGGSTPTPTPTP